MGGSFSLFCLWLACARARPLWFGLGRFRRFICLLSGFGIALIFRRCRLYISVRLRLRGIRRRLVFRGLFTVVLIGSILFIPVSGLAASATPPAATALGLAFAVRVIATVLNRRSRHIRARSRRRFIRIQFRLIRVDLIHQRRVHRHHILCGDIDHASRRLEFLHREIGAHQRWIALDPDRQTVAALNLCDMFALLVHKEVGNAHGRLDQHLARPLARPLFLDLAQDRQREVVVRADQTRAVTGLTGLRRRLDHARAQALA